MTYHKYFLSAALGMLGSIAATGAEIDCTPGALSNLVTDPSAATALVIKGQINAADLFFIDKEMPQLRSLDLSGATIAAYDGASLRGLRHYDAATIPASALAGSKISEIIWPEAEVTVGDMAFSSTGLTSVDIPANVSLGSGCFSACLSLTSAKIEGTNTGTYTFKGCSALESLVLPAATSVGAALAADCPALEEVTAPLATTLGDRAFEDCTALTAYDFPAALGTIGAQTFAGSGLENVNLAACTSLTSIGEWAFAKCTSLMRLELPSSAYTLGQGAFFDCNSLASVSTPSGPATIPAYAFKGASLSAEPLAIPAGVSSLGDYSLAGSGATEVVLPSTLESVGSHAMEGMTNLESIDARSLTTVPTAADDAWEGVVKPEVVLNVGPDMADQFLASPAWQTFNIKGTSITGIDGTDAAEVNISARFEGTVLLLQTQGSDMAGIEIYSPSGLLEMRASLEGDRAAIQTESFASRILIVRCLLADGSVAILKLAR